MKSAKLEWALNNLDQAIILLDDALQKFGEFPKLWLMKGQIREQQGLIEEAHATYSAGVSIFPPKWRIYK